jgi:hypothetical protein
LTLQEVQDIVADMVVNLLAVLPGMGYETVMGFSWEELNYWHTKTQRLRGHNE